MTFWINENRTDKECLENCIRCCRGDKKEIKWTKTQPIKDLRYIDNQLRIYVARQNWDKISKSVITNLVV